jgi:hypothetical protein
LKRIGLIDGVRQALRHLFGDLAWRRLNGNECGIAVQSAAYD